MLTGKSGAEKSKQAFAGVFILEKPLEWKSKFEVLEGGRVRRIWIYGDTKPLLNSNVIRCWQEDTGFRKFFTSLLANAPFEAFLWETHPLTADSLHRAYEFVLVDCPALNGVQANPAPFEKQIKSRMADNDIATFPNLGGDALLIAPCGIGPLRAYSHIAAFVRNAEEAQQHALWISVGTALEEHISEKPIWLSTSGLGVFWLHVRLDSYPKYYNFTAYRDGT